MDETKPYARLGMVKQSNSNKQLCSGKIQSASNKQFKILPNNYDDSNFYNEPILNSAIFDIQKKQSKITGFHPFLKNSKALQSARLMQILNYGLVELSSLNHKILSTSQNQECKALLMEEVMTRLNMYTSTIEKVNVELISILSDYSIYKEKGRHDEIKGINELVMDSNV